MILQRFVVRLEHHHRVKIVVTTGCFMGVVAALVPGMGLTAQLVALATNLVWLWEE